MQIYTGTEYSALVVHDYDLTERDRDYVSRFMTLYKNAPFKLYELKNGLRFEFSSYVGVLELEGARIIIQPKFNRGFQDVVELLLFVEDLPAALLHCTQATYGEHSLIELLVRLFVKEAEILLQRGVQKEYVTEEDRLSVVRGRIDLRKQLYEHHFRPGKVYCQYDELTTNIVENQVIRTALEIAKRFPLTKQTMRQVNRLLNEWVPLADGYQVKQWPIFTYHRLNEHYRTAHILASYLFNKMYMSNVYAPQQEGHYSFLVDMNELFERFVTQLLKKYLPASMKVTEQRVFQKAIMKDGSSYRYIRPDLVVEGADRGLLVVDAKYKPYGEKKVANSDIYQLSFYAQFLSREEKFRAVIIYPRYAGEDGGEERIELLPDRAHGGWLYVREVLVEGVLEAVREREVGYLREVALGLVRWNL